MDRKTEDLIARLAFGELTEAEAAQVRAMAGRDADTAKALDSYELLRSDLRQMRDVPHDQLSKERLQSAILAQGLKPRPVRHGFPWVWAPVATVAAALALFVFMQPSNHGVPGGEKEISHDIVARNDTVIPNDPYTSPLNTDDTRMLTQTIERVAATPRPEETTKAPPAPVRRSRTVHRYHASGREQEHTPDMEPAKLALNSASAPRSTVAASQPRESIVLIQTERDGNTGAKSAVEVQQTEDVIVSS